MLLKVSIKLGTRVRILYHHWWPWSGWPLTRSRCHRTWTSRVPRRDTAGSYPPSSGWYFRRNNHWSWVGIFDWAVKSLIQSSAFKAMIMVTGCRKRQTRWPPVWVQALGRGLRTWGSSTHLMTFRHYWTKTTPQALKSLTKPLVYTNTYQLLLLKAQQWDTAPLKPPQSPQKSNAAPQNTNKGILPL